MAFVDPISSDPHDAQRTNGDAAYRGHRVIDEQHRTVGRVTDVIFADDGTPRWAVVSAGLFRGEHLLPLQQAYISLDGDVVVPYDRRTVTKAPKVNRDHVLTQDVERDLEHYYRLAA
jgi:hypothetical protein